jgi:CubicO group peptidase (beta-lactamase class C family)
VLPKEIPFSCINRQVGFTPVDANFASITIQNLLEHKSGLNTDAFSNGVAVVAAFVAAGHSASLPVTQQMTDSYIASLPLVSAPGAVQAYSNCGYYLLGRIVAQLAGTSAPIDAYHASLLSPLGIARIRSAVDLVSAQAGDEARYQAAAINGPLFSDLTVGNSLMTPDQPLVPSGYGDGELAIGQGAGGLSGATTDIARLIAILIDKKDNPALKRKTIVSMLKDGAALTAAGMGRAGYGLDAAVDQGGGNFYGQKGGELINAASVLQFNGQWGFTVCWGSPAQVPNVAPSWYPDFGAAMSIAMGVSWSAGDLFPDFGMPSL